MSEIISGTPNGVTPWRPTVHCNRHPRPLVQVVAEYGAWVPATHPAQYDDAVSGFEYMGEWFALEDFERAGDDVKRLGFDGVMPDNAFSAIVVSFFDRDGYDLTQEDLIIVGRIHW